jgi:hypothetical protein
MDPVPDWPEQIRVRSLSPFAKAARSVFTRFADPRNRNRCFFSPDS